MFSVLCVLISNGKVLVPLIPISTDKQHKTMIKDDKASLVYELGFSLLPMLGEDTF